MAKNLAYPLEFFLPLDVIYSTAYAVAQCRLTAPVCPMAVCQYWRSKCRCVIKISRLSTNDSLANDTR